MVRPGLLALLLLLTLPARAGADNMKERKTLKPDEGVLVATVVCGHPVRFVQLYDSGTKSSGFWGPAKFSAVMTCQPVIKTMPLKAGHYYIGYLGTGGTSGTAIPEENAPSLVIEAGKLNYVGEIYVGELFVKEAFDMDPETLAKVTGRLFTVMDREDKARTELADDYAWLLERHPFVSAIATGASP